MSLQDLKASLPIEAVVNRSVPLKKQGANLVGLCPFHGEKTPSFTVSPQRQRFHCFGCGADGDVIDFQVRITGRPFREVCDQLAAEAGVTLIKTQPKHQGVFKPLKRKDTPSSLPDGLLERFRGWQRGLKGAEGYLAKRGIPIEVAEQFGAGFLPAGESVEAGFSGPRLLLPHTDPDGQIVSLYGRSFSDDKAIKHRHLSGTKGLLNASALKEKGPLYVAEGAFDVMALRAAGASKVVGIWGVDGVDLRLFAKQTEVILAFDTDQAGQQAVAKFRDDFRYLGAKVSVLQVQGKDVAEDWLAGALRLPGETKDPLLELKLMISRLGDAPHPHLKLGWPGYVSMAQRFALKHLDRALSLGWTLEELFSLPWNSSSGGGAVWVLAGFEGEITVEQDRILVGQLVYRKTDVTGELPFITV